MTKTIREERRRARKRKEQARTMIFAGIVLVVLGLSGYFLKQAFFKPAPPPVAGNVIDIKADMNGFDNKEIVVKVGQPVTIRLTSMDNSAHTDGGGKHQFAVDELNLNVVAQPLKSNYVTFTPDKPGQYTFYCDICCGGKANPTMSGTLVVQG